MSIMNSLSKGKYISSGMNIYPNTKTKEADTKNKKPFTNNEGIKTQVITLGTQAINPNRKIISPNPHAENSNSFRQTGILNMKFKTTKNSPEKNLLNEIHFSGDKSKQLIHNYIKQTSVNNNDYGHLTTPYPKEQYLESNEIEDNTMEFMKRKLLKKKNDPKLKSNYLNFTNPVQTLGSSVNKQSVTGIVNNAHNSNLSHKATTPGTSTISNSNLKLNLTKTSTITIEDKNSKMNNLNESKSELATIVHGNGLSSPRYEKAEGNGNKTKPGNMKPVSVGSNYVNKIMSKITNPSSVISTLKKKKEEGSNPLNFNINNTSATKLMTNNCSKTKVSSTTPVTNKTSRKNSFEKTKNVIDKQLVTKNKPLVQPINNFPVSVNSNYVSNQSANSNLTSENRSTIQSNIKYNENADHDKKGILTAKSLLSNSQNLSNSLKAFDLAYSHGNLQNVMNYPQVNKATTLTNSLVASCVINTSTSKKKASLISSHGTCTNLKKGGGKIDDKSNDVMKKTYVEKDIKKTNPSSISTSTSNNFKQLQTGLMFKKHQTSTNSPTHFPFHFKKETSTTSKPFIAKTQIVQVEKHSKANSISKKKEEPNVIGRSKPATSLKFNEQGHSDKKLNLLNKGRSSFTTAHSKDKIINKNTKPIKADVGTAAPLNTDEAHFPIELENSFVSVKSTVRESNYYKREAEKISSYIQQYYNSNREYPSSSIKFYKIGRLLGRGAFGKVNLGLHLISGRLVAIKSFNKSNLTSESSKRKIYAETNIMKNLRHNSIVKIYETFETQKYIMIIMEYVCGGDLLTFIRKRAKLSETTSKFIFRQIIEAIQYIHSQKVIHRDIKLDNILIDLDNNIKLCDFGVGRIVKNDELMHDQCGTPAYIAPEILRNDGYEGYGVDIWSSGVVLYAMLSGTVPFKATNMNDLHKLILKGQYNPIKDISKEATDLLERILEIDPLKRLTTEQILQHKWLLNNDPYSSNGKMKTKMNLFTNAERILLSRSNVDYRSANKEDLIENFTLKNLDSMQEYENQNINTKSYILAPFNSSLKGEDSIMIQGLKIENDALKLFGKVKELNRNYELNNNGEIDNGIIINPNPIQNQNTTISVSKPIQQSICEDNKDKPKQKSNVISKRISLASSPIKDLDKEIPSPKEDFHRNSRKELLAMNSTAKTFIIDDNVLNMIESIGYKKDSVLKWLYNNELNYATAAYYLLLHTNQD